VHPDPGPARPVNYEWALRPAPVVPPPAQVAPARARKTMPLMTILVAAIVTLVVAALLVSQRVTADPASVNQPNAAAVAPARRSPSTTTPRSRPAPTPPTTASPTSPSSPPSSVAPATPGPSSGSDIDGPAVAKQIDLSVVDIVTRTPGGSGAGTGVVISADGDVITNNHVIEGATEIQVTSVTTGAIFPGTVVGTDPVNDVAVVHLVGATKLTVAPIGDSDAVKIGDAVAAIGNAGGQGGEPDVAEGNVIALHQTITAADLDGSNSRTLTDLIQVDANAQPGDSGGPLVSAKAEVIGIDVAGSAPRGRRPSATHEGYAIPINRAMAIAKQIQANPSAPGAPGSASPATPALGGGYLGIQVAVATTGTGATVVAVQANSPAAAAGLKAGDVITAVDGTELTAPTDLSAILAKHQGGDTVTITWRSPDGAHQASVRLGRR
jgi:S1-C subfamily serine protease